MKHYMAQPVRRVTAWRDVFQPYLGVWWVAMVERQGVVVLKRNQREQIYFY